VSNLFKMKKTVLFSILISALIIISCKKETVEESQSETELKPLVIKLKNSSYSKHYLLSFQTREMSFSKDSKDQEWSENHLGLLNIIKPADSTFVYFDIKKYTNFEYRIGIISEEGLIVDLDDQEGYIYTTYPNFNGSPGEHISLILTILTDNSGYIYLSDY